MTNNPLDLFTPEDFKKMIGRTDCKVEYLACSIASHILEERLSVGYTSLGPDRAPNLVTNKCADDDDTHKILYHLIPLEAEDPECEHKLEYEFDEPIPVGGSGFRIARIKEGQIKFCPKCGKKLK